MILPPRDASSRPRPTAWEVVVVRRSEARTAELAGGPQSPAGPDLRGAVLPAVPEETR